MGIIRAPTGSTPPVAASALNPRESQAMQPFETVYVETDVVACNGSGGALGHPKVYLNLSAEGKIECPYCSRLFIHETNRAQPAAGSPAAAPKP
jgi:uncharacterized Zn-finger protein